MFNKESYERHKKLYSQHVAKDDMREHARTWLDQGSTGHWRQQRMYGLLDPLLKVFKGATWVTIGDGSFGNDSQYLTRNGADAIATDISPFLLEVAKKESLINNYSVENAESLSFGDDSFDFAYCKEAYHHFPRPNLALYEMLRVARKGVVLLEPHDRFADLDLKKYLFLGLKIFIKKLLNKPIIKHEYEEVGNYLFSLSKREVEKIALGLNLRYVAFSEINDYYIKGIEYEKKSEQAPLYKQFMKKIKFTNLLTKIGIQHPSLLQAVIFKKDLAAEEVQLLRNQGLQIIDLGKNPYID